MTQRTATGLCRYKVEKGYGKWWDQLFPLVASRESSDRSNKIESSADTDSDENNSLKGQSIKNYNEDQKIMYLNNHHLVRKKKIENFSDCL